MAEFYDQREDLHAATAVDDVQIVREQFGCGLMEAKRHLKTKVLIERIQGGWGDRALRDAVIFLLSQYLLDGPRQYG